jgi:hypothetical protein
VRRHKVCGVGLTSDSHVEATVIVIEQIPYDAASTVRERLASQQKLDMVIGDDDLADRLAVAFPDAFDGAVISL